MSEPTQEFLAVPPRLALRIAQHLQSLPGQPFLDELNQCQKVQVEVPTQLKALDGPPKKASK